MKINRFLIIVASIITSQVLAWLLSKYSVLLLGAKDYHNLVMNLILGNLELILLASGLLLVFIVVMLARPFWQGSIEWIYCWVRGK